MIHAAVLSGASIPSKLFKNEIADCRLIDVTSLLSVLYQTSIHNHGIHTTWHNLGGWSCLDCYQRKDWVQFVFVHASGQRTSTQAETDGHGTVFCGA